MAIKQGKRNEDQSTSDKEVKEVVGAEGTTSIFEESELNQSIDVDQPASPVQMMSLDDVMKLIGDKDAEHKAEIEKLLDKEREKTRAMIDRKSKKLDDEEYFDEVEEDYLQDAVVFFTFSTQSFIYADFRNGKEIKCPNGKVHFKCIHRQIRKTSGGEKSIQISSVKVQSKRQLEFLRSHTLFNVQFFEDINHVKNVDAVWAAKLVEMNTQISQFSDAQIIDRSRILQLPITKDLTQMRRDLVEHMAKMQRRKEEELSESRISTQHKTDGGSVIESNVISATGMTMDDNGRLIG